MRKLLTFLIALGAIVFAVVAPGRAQMSMTGAGSSKVSVATYQGPGDIVSGAIAWGSCARVYDAALATTSTSLCDLVDSAAPSTVICTLRGTATGFVDLVGTYCTGGVTPATKCAAATGGVCHVSKMYDQTGTGNNWTNTTAATQPILTFSALGSLPGMTGTNGAGTLLVTATITQAQPVSFMVVAERTSTAGGGTGILATNSVQGGISYNTGANTVFTNAGSFFSATQTDNAFHALFVVNNGASSVIEVDSGAATNANGGTTGLSTGLRFMNGTAATNGIGMEAGLWPIALTPTQYGNLNSNAHSAMTGYNF